MNPHPHDPPAPLPPSGAPLLLRALLKRPRQAPPPGIDATYRLDRIDPGHVRRYNRAFAFPGDTIALPYLYLVAQRAQLAAMLARPIPFRIPGLVHVENWLAMHGPVRPGAPLDLTTALYLPPPEPHGALHCVLRTRALDSARLAFSCDSTYLIARAGDGARPRPAPPAPPPGRTLGHWTVAADAGRRYAALSGDWNPIHLWPWSARLMGMRAPIIHGMHTVAMACSLFQRAAGAPVGAVQCRFRRPVPLGSRLDLQETGPGRLAVVLGGRVAVDCTVSAA